MLRRGEQRLIAASESGSEDDYAAVLSGVKAWTLVTIVLIVIAIFFMGVKPF